MWPLALGESNLKDLSVCACQNNHNRPSTLQASKWLASKTTWWVLAVVSRRVSVGAYTSDTASYFDNVKAGTFVQLFDAQ